MENLYEIEFIYEGKTTNMEFNSDEKMRDIFKKFENKSSLTNKKLFYLHGGNLINEDMILDKIIDKTRKLKNKISIYVYEDKESNSKLDNKSPIKPKIIICPECKENIKLDIIDFKINLYECKNGHKIDNILLNEFEEIQRIELDKIICDNCKVSNKSNSYNNKFYKCLTCKRNICPLCSINHDKMHKIINYDDKYYKCEDHSENYISFCETCKKNICLLCNGHENHEKINFKDIIPNKESLLKKLDELKNKMYLIKTQLKMLKSLLDEVLDNLQKYYKIFEEIILNYDNNKRNYESIHNLNQLINNNIVDELDKLINNNIITSKYNIFFNIISDSVKLFGKDFVKNNKDNCKLIIDGKEQDLKEYYKFGLFGKKKKTLEVKLKNITKITNMSNIFSGCTSLSSIQDISKWNIRTVTNMSGIFSECSSLSSLPDISKWNTSNISDFNEIFANCSSLISLPDISRWNTSCVMDMSKLFYKCSSLTALPDISGWETYNVTDMKEMFSNCSSLLSLPDISKWDVSNVTSMCGLFYNCSSLKSIPDISKWNTFNVINMNNMFNGCSSLTALPNMDKWDISNLSLKSHMFDNCKANLKIPEKFKK